ncbi:hypothetical protein OEB99_11355 [Actinotalea sp. M2MS4P-6]|uniref:hypothetical protein n=1 Tax=Actinotalea sp. M2MS4P-6 TaxID=2983762 RepID=UPI0021E370D5|nr:hypothetical protein [Actinotalea sp. M2MS4P-6]MCV2394907.1 hypothetical protein [Actinotalea sp. M2MS4P-6]
MTMEFDLDEALAAMHRQARDGADALPVEAVVRRARRHRIAKRSGYGAVGMGAAVALALGAVSLAQGTPAPVATSPEVATTPPSPSETPASAPTADVTQAPGAVGWSPNLSRCGMPGQTWVEARDGSDGQVSVINYWGWDEATSTDEWPTRSDAIWVDDHGGTTMTVEVLDAVVMPDGEGWGDVVAVLGGPVDPVDVDVTSGSEGGGTGSTGLIDLAVPLATCDGGSTLPDGTYTTITRYHLTVGATSVLVYGQSTQYLGASPWVNEPAPIDVPASVDLSAEVPACGSRYQLDEVHYVEGESEPLWFLEPLGHHLYAPDGGVGPWVDTIVYGGFSWTWSGSPAQAGYTDPVAVLVRRSDGLVVARTDLQSVAQHWAYDQLQVPPDRSTAAYPWPEVTLMGQFNLEWTPVGCADLGQGIEAGVPFDPGNWDDDLGYTLHVGQRLLMDDGTTRWFWWSDNPNDPQSAP